MKLSGKIIVIAILLLFSISAFAQNENGFSLSGEDLENGQSFTLAKEFWKYHAGDNSDWSNPAFDDSDWQSLSPANLNFNNSWQNWNGIAWFRTKLNIDESLVGQPISLTIWHQGASEIYLDGKLLKKFGEMRENDDTEFNPQGIPVPLVFSKADTHTLAIRYSFRAARDLSGGVGAWLAHGKFSPGIFIYLQSSYAAQNSYVSRQLDANQYKLFSGILFAFAFLHFWLFIFYRQERANLYYSTFAFLLASGNALSSISNNSQQSAVVSTLIFILFAVSYSSAFLALLSFLYVAFAEKFSKFFWFLCAYLLVLIIVTAIYSRDYLTLYLVVGFILLTVGGGLRIMFSALRHGKKGAWIIVIGLCFFTLGVFMLVTNALEILRWTGIFEIVEIIALNLAIPIAVSIYLARNFARVNQNLEEKIIEVESFSEREIEHEKEKSRMLIVEAENERRAQELEEARQLQLSMLPKKLPQIEGLEIAAYMKPATEVGGDYYDFHVGKDGTLTIAVGDATGHGLKAGTIVTATKSLFNAFADQKDIPQILSQTSGALKKMNLRGLFMAMAMLKIKDGAMTLCVAGMPSVLIYRAESQIVEEISLRAMPLGSIAKTKYQESEISLGKGDVVVLMSDGFPEMFNPDNEMLGFDKAAEVLMKTGINSPQEIIDRFVEISEQWSGTRPADDDVTFVVMKVKTG